MSEAREQQLMEMLKTANGLIRSFSAVCDREGSNTYWPGLTKQVRQVLADQHMVLHPEAYVTSPRDG